MSGGHRRTCRPPTLREYGGAKCHSGERCCRSPTGALSKRPTKAQLNSAARFVADFINTIDPKRTRSVRRSTHLAPVKAESAAVHAVANIIQRLKRYNQSICAVIVKSFLSIGFTGAKFSSFIKPHNSLRCRTRNFDKFPFCLKQVVTRRLAL